MNEQFPGMQPSSEPLSVKEWFVTLFITYIPLVGLIMMLVWAFDSSTNVNKKNFAKASLIWMLIGIALAIVFLIAFAPHIRWRQDQIPRFAGRLKPALIAANVVAAISAPVRVFSTRYPQEARQIPDTVSRITYFSQATE